MPYFTLLQRDTETNKWGIAFGDYDKETVLDEKQDYRDHDVKAKNLKIVETPTALQSDIDAILADLNEEES